MRAAHADADWRSSVRTQIPKKKKTATKLRTVTVADEAEEDAEADGGASNSV